uniref:oleoyl-[acyl-carrier-protein] hydrolase n=1 Tax=Spermophilus dauricus TaxID=99837 RepID=A0A8C9P8F3_SPEDA
LERGDSPQFLAFYFWQRRLGGWAGGQEPMPENEKVFNCLYPKPNAIFKLICFPWAGSDSTYFAKWGQNIYDSMEVSCLRLAGRESRLEEHFANDINQVVEETVHALLPIIQDKPFAFFGHRYLNILKDSWGNFFTNSCILV